MPPVPRVFDAPTLRAAVDLDLDVVATIEAAFAALGRGEGVMPPVLRLDIPGRPAEMDVKTAWLPDLPVFCLKVSTGFFDNAARGLPSLDGMMVAIDAQTGGVRAVLLDRGWLTDVRTAAAGAVAARWLARADATVAAIVGTGVQARLQARALALVRPIARYRVAGRDLAKARAAAADIAAATGREAVAVDSVEAAVRDADVIVTATASTTPLLRAQRLQPGQHVTAVGADAEHKQELDAQALARADRVVVDRRTQCERLGELHHALAAGVIDLGRVVELGEVVVGLAAGRTSPDAITVCDLTGTGAQDTAIAALTLARLGI
ncbi:MAG: cyclodeaminase [Burkholderiales bacterium]|nr:cyclodeaminase [Burkholderiales bacterium]